MSIAQKFSNTIDETEYERKIDLLNGSSIITWQHINMLWEYNFETKGRKLPFEIQKVFDLKVMA